MIQALLGHAPLDTVMVYAKLYPSTLVEEYRKAVRAIYVDFTAPSSLRNPTAEEWAEFASQLRAARHGHPPVRAADRRALRAAAWSASAAGTHSRRRAPPRVPPDAHKPSAQLACARENAEPAGQIAARELEVIRIESALRRADELSRRRRRHDRRAAA